MLAVSNNAGPSEEKRASSAPGKGSDMPFHKVADCFEGLYRAENRDKRLQLLRKLWKRHGRPGMYPLMRLMLPGMDTKRPNYHLKEKMLAQLYISMLGLPPDSESAKELISWKRPSALSRASAGDFPEKAFAVIERRCPSAESLGPRRVTIADMNALLEELAVADGTPAKQVVLRKMHTRLTALEQKWVLRIVLKDMQLGIKEATIFKEYHPDAEERYNSVCDMEAMCSECEDRDARLDVIDIQLFHALNPKNCNRTTWEQVPKIMGKQGDFVAEGKLDGERVMLHFERRRGGGGGGDSVWTRCWGGRCLCPDRRRCFLLMRRCCSDNVAALGSLGRRQVRLCIALMAINHFTVIGMAELFPLFASAPTGLRMQPQQIGAALTPLAVALCVWPFVFVRLERQHGPVATLRIGQLAFAMVNATMPLLVLLRDSPLLWVGLVAVGLCRGIGGNSSFPSLAILLNSMLDQHLGAMNGFAASVGSLVRAIAPVACGSLFSAASSISESPEVAQGLPFYLLVALLLCGLGMTAGLSRPGQPGSEQGAAPASAARAVRT